MGLSSKSGNCGHYTTHCGIMQVEIKFLIIFCLCLIGFWCAEKISVPVWGTDILIQALSGNSEIKLCNDGAVKVELQHIISRGRGNMGNVNLTVFRISGVPDILPDQ